MRLLAIVMSVGLAACATERANANEFWHLTELDGVAVIENAEPTLALAEGQAYGTTGCNSFVGEYVQSNDQVTISNLETTLMACVRPPRTDIPNLESQFLRSLSGTSRISAEGNEMVLTRSDGVTLRFIRRSAR